MLLENLVRLDSQTRKEKVFCLNSGNCGSKYLVSLLKANGAHGCFHEKIPDFDNIGVNYYLNNKISYYERFVLWRTRRDIYIESSNRLFSLAKPIQQIFPRAKFLHLHREGRAALTSIVNKTLFPDLFRNSDRLRYRSMLAGPPNIDAFARACHYWANYNQRIYDDILELDHRSIKFDDMIMGEISEIEDILGLKLNVKLIGPVNEKKDIKRTDFDNYHYENWDHVWKATFESICGKTNRLLGYE